MPGSEATLNGREPAVNDPDERLRETMRVGWWKCQQTLTRALLSSPSVGRFCPSIQISGSFAITQPLPGTYFGTSVVGGGADLPLVLTPADASRVSRHRTRAPQQRPKSSRQVDQHTRRIAPFERKGSRVTGDPGP